MYFTLWNFITLTNIIAEFTLILTTVSVLWGLVRFLKYPTGITTFKLADSRFSLISLLAGIISFNSLILCFFLESQNNYIYFTSLNLQGYVVSSTKKGNYCNNFGEVEVFGLILLFLANYIGIVSKTTLDSRLRLDNLNFVILILYFNLILVYFINAVNFIEFFLLYEFLLIPSFLIVYLTGYSRRAINSSIYFLVWTQLGSLLVLCAFIILINVFQVESFDLNWYYVGGNVSLYNLTISLLILGFGVKVPLWPFHYWITKTHVEAPTGFSIYLSGFLVKTALFGLYKTLSLVCIQFNLYLFLCIVLLGFLDSSFKFWTQSDIKKLVAYCTIQEMNLIMLLFIFGNTKFISTGVLFTITHALLSGLMFYVVDCIYRRYGSRSITEVHGILTVCPNLAIVIICMQLCFVGLPGTVKFLVEFNLITGLLWCFPRTTIFLMVLNILGVIGFSKIWFNIIFGVKKIDKIIFIDLTILEFSVCISLIILQFFFTFYYVLLV